MKTKREEKMEQELSLCKQALSVCRKELHRERQKNRDMNASRNNYKLKNSQLNVRLKAAETVKKNGKPDLSENTI